MMAYDAVVTFIMNGRLLCQIRNIPGQIRNIPAFTFLALLAIQSFHLTPVLAKDVPQSKAQMQLSFAPIVKRVTPAVVNIHASRKAVVRRRSPFFNDPFFERFFGNQNDFFGMPRERVQKSLGSGVIISPEGYIVTNHHVIDGMTDIRIALIDRREFDCEIVLQDQRTDLAVLKVKGNDKDFPFVDFANSEDLEVGDLVLAIGNPFGIGQTVTSGIVSALARTDVGISDYQFFVQTDAAINPGNSGGALINMNGQLVGINTAIFSRSGGSNGIGFAIPSNMVSLVTRSAQFGGVVKRPWLGATLQDVTQDLAKSLGLDKPSGVIITELHENGPAQNAGLEVGDILLEIEGHEILDSGVFAYRFATKSPGETARLKVKRNSKIMDFDLALSTAPETTPRDVISISGRTPFEGLTIANLSPALAEELNFQGDPDGVVITKVARNSNAARIGLQPLDILLKLNGSDISTSQQFNEVSHQRTQFWRFSILRKGRVISSIIGG